MLAATTEGKQRLDALRAEFAALSAAQQEETAERRATSQALRRRMVNTAAAGALISAALLILLGFYMNRFVLLPVRRVERAAERLAEGQPHTRVPATGPGEIGQLGAAFNAMAESLAARKDDLRVQNDRLRGILDHTTMTISVKDREGRYLLVNDEWRRAMGQVGVDVIGRTDDELFPPDVAAGIRVTDLEILRSGEDAEFERPGVDGRSFQLVKFPLKRRRRRRLRDRHDGHRRHRAPPRARRGGRRLALEVGVPGQHEPRDPHADERRDRHDRAAAPTPSSTAEQREYAETARQLRRGAARRSSTTSSTSPRSRPASSSSTRTTSTCATLVEDTLRDARAAGARARAWS